MGFSKAWEKQGIKPKKGWDLEKKAVNVKRELDKLAAKKDETGGKN